MHNRNSVKFKLQSALNIISPLFLLLFVSSLFLSCTDEKSTTEPGSGYNYSVPEPTDDGWETASLKSVNMDPFPMINLMNDLNGMAEHRIHSLLIVRDGKLVFEEYFPGDKFNLAQYTGETGFNRDDTHNLCSVTKSFTSALIGIAIGKGYIQSVDQKVFDFFPEFTYILNSQPDKDNITLKYLLTMTSGLEWDDESYPYSDPRNDLNQLFRNSNPIRYILLKPLIETPGTVFAYRNCNTNLLGEIVHIASEDRLDVFSEKHLFSKLGITEFEWQMLPNNIVFCSGDLRLRPRDMAKFGYLFLNDGIWQNEQIISSEWVDFSTQKLIDPNNYTANFSWADGYGYQWWIWEEVYQVEFQAYMASGWGGQWIIISPPLDLVIVSTAGNYYSEVLMPIERIIVDYILPSISQGS